MIIGKIIAMIFTLILIYLIIKELRKVIKESNDGKCSDKCDLD